MEKWRCAVCGYIHEGELPEGFECPRCKQPADAFVKMEQDNTGRKSLYAGTKTEKNLWTAFAGEAQARSKYTRFATEPFPEQRTRKKGKTLNGRSDV